ncbi:MAG: MmgE/PrpD family protein, partial [Nitrospinae bacterium]|nr:MmgE/PrpD family protein [Nitrospinota bacterium]
MGVTERMAEFIVETKWADFPALAIERAKKAAVDTVGVTLAGASEPVGRIVADFARKMGGAPEASIIGLGARAAAPMAALANGAIGHALDFDDSSYLLSGHPSVVVLPAVLAQGEKQGASGREVLEAFVIGYEISTKLGLGMNPEHYGAGWHSTCTLGTLGAAAAAAHLRG